MEPAQGTGGNGIVYHSVRRAGGTNVCIYRPSLIILPVVQADHYEYRWDAAGQVTVLKVTSIGIGDLPGLLNLEDAASPPP